MTLNEIENNLRTLDYEELKQLNKSVISNMKFLSERQGAQKKRSLSVNSRVQFKGRNGETLQGTVTKKNRTKAIVTVEKAGGYPQQWNVPFNMLSEVGQ